MRFIVPMLSALCAGSIALSFSAVFAADTTANNNVVKDGSVVSLQYTLSGDDGKTIESNKGKDPLKYTQGSHQIIPGLEKSLAGMKVGDEKHVKVAAKDAYGEVDPRAVQEVPKDKIPPNGLKVGAVLMASGPQGQPVPVTVKEVKEKTVVIDMNHPMAGKNLVFDVKVLDVQPASATSTTAPVAPAPAPKPAQPK